MHENQSHEASEQEKVPSSQNIPYVEFHNWDAEVSFLAM